MSPIATSLVSVFDVAQERLARRLEGLDDVEYLWEPAPGCWSVRPGPEGHGVVDGGEAGEPPPPTTIAWRSHHVGAEVLGGFAGWFLDGALSFDDERAWPLRAAEAVDLLARGYARWREGLAAFPEQRWWQPIGPTFGPFAEDSAVDLALHVLDEFVHHAAEIALLRDLYLRRP